MVLQYKYRSVSVYLLVRLFCHKTQNQIPVPSLKHYHNMGYYHPYDYNYYDYYSDLDRHYYKTSSSNEVQQQKRHQGWPWGDMFASPSGGGHGKKCCPHVVDPTSLLVFLSLQLICIRVCIKRTQRVVRRKRTPVTQEMMQFHPSAPDHPPSYL